MTEAVAVLVAVFVFFSIFGGENFLSAGGAASWLTSPPNWALSHFR